MQIKIFNDYSVEAAVNEWLKNHSAACVYDVTVKLCEVFDEASGKYVDRQIAVVTYEVEEGPLLDVVSKFSAPVATEPEKEEEPSVEPEDQTPNKDAILAALKAHKGDLIPIEKIVECGVVNNYGALYYAVATGKIQKGFRIGRDSYYNKNDIMGWVLKRTERKPRKG